MQKFGLLFLAVSTALLGLVVPVEGLALEGRETNADRFARGLPPLPQRAVPNEREVAKRSKPSKRDPTPTIEERGHPSKRALMPALELRSKPSKRADYPEVAKRSKPSKRADTSVEKRSKPSKRADTTVERRSKPSKRADTTVERRSKPSKRADTTVERRSKPSKRADTVVEKRSKPSKRADTTVEKRSKPSKRADTTVERRSKPSKRATPVDVEKRSKPSKRAEAVAEVFHAQYWQLNSGRLEVRWACNDSIAGYVANNPTGGSFGLNDGMLSGEDDLYVEYFDSNLMVMNPEFPPPYFVGGGDEASSVHDCSGKIRFGAVELGSSSAVWTLDPMTGALNATLTNQDGSEDKPSLVFDSAHNVLNFAHDVNRIPTSEPVYIYLSD